MMSKTEWDLARPYSGGIHGQCGGTLGKAHTCLLKYYFSTRRWGKAQDLELVRRLFQTWTFHPLWSQPLFPAGWYGSHADPGGLGMVLRGWGWLWVARHMEGSAHVCPTSLLPPPPLLLWPSSTTCTIIDFSLNKQPLDQVDVTLESQSPGIMYWHPASLTPDKRA